MRISTFITISLSVAASLLCCSPTAKAETSSSQTKTYTLQFSDFHELKVTDGINVTYRCDPSHAGKIEFEARAEVASAVIFTPGKGKLTVSIASRDSSYTNLPEITVYSSMLSSVRNEGDSTVRVISPAPVPKLTARLIGNGNIAIRDCKATETSAEIISGRGIILLTGSTAMAKFNVMGAGSIQADDFETKECSATITGTGSIACYPIEKLSVGGLGSGTVSYRGTPREIKNKFISTVKTKQL